MQSGLERRVQEHEVEARRRLARQPGQRVHAFDADGIGVQARCAFAERGGEARVAFEQQHAGGSARGGFEAECAGAGEGVEYLSAGDVVLQPVEQRFARAIAGGPQARRIRHRQLRTAQAAGDHAHVSRRSVHRGSRRVGDNIHAFSPMRPRCSSRSAPKSSR